MKEISLRHLVLDACDGPFGSAIKSEHYADEGARVIRLGNIGTGEWRDEAKAFLPPDYWRQLASHHAQPGDVVMAGLGDEGHPVGRTCVVPGYINQALVKADCYRLRLDPRLANARFVAAFLSSRAGLAQAEALAEGSTRQRLTLSKALSIRLPAVGLSEQSRVADFLDAETTRIDALIAKKRLLMQLIGERMSSGVDRLALGVEQPNLGLSATGFFDAVPDGWYETQLRHLGCEVQTGPFGSQLHAADYVLNGWPVINPANIRDGNIIADLTITVNDQTRSQLVRHVLRAGDIVFGRRGEMGRAGLVGDKEDGWLCGTGSIRLRLGRSPLLPDYFKLFLETAVARKYFELSSVGSTMENLNTEILLSFPCLVPLRERQRAIVSSVARIRQRGIGAATAIEHQVALLQEHRQALITAAVTGQLDVAARMAG